MSGRSKRGGLGAAGLVLAILTLLSLAIGASPAAAQPAGRVLAWGGNSAGQLGTGLTDPASIPEASALPAGVTTIAVAGGAGYSLAVTSTGGVLAWGTNGSGQLGTGTNAPSLVPAAVSILAGTVITAIAAGASHSLALTSTGTLLAWGSNSSGQLGNPNVVGPTSNLPVALSLPTGATVSAIAAGGTSTPASGHEHKNGRRSGRADDDPLTPAR